HQPPMPRDDLAALEDDRSKFDYAIDGRILPCRLRIDGHEQQIADGQRSVELVDQTLRDDAQKVGNAGIMPPCREAAAAFLAGPHGFLVGAEAEGAADGASGSSTFFGATFLPVRCSISSSIQSFTSSSKLNCSSSKWRPLM